MTIIMVPFYCEVCKKETPHEVLKKTTGKNTTVFLGKCTVCGISSKHTVSLKEEKTGIDIKLIYSKGASTSTAIVNFDKYDKLKVGDILPYQGMHIKITKLENLLHQPRKRMPVTNISTIWGTINDTVTVKISVNMKDYTKSISLEVPPSETFVVGDVIKVNKQNLLITGIVTKHKSLREGTAIASEIVRVHSKKVRNREG